MPYFLLAAALFAVFLALGLGASPAVSAEMLKGMEEMLDPLGKLSYLQLFGLIFVNNAGKALGAILLGILLGLPPLVFIIFNGFAIGAVLSALAASVGYGAILASLAPHGIIEIPMLLLASALGLSVGRESLNRLQGRKSQVRSRLIGGLKVYAKWVLPGLLVAAAIEAFITPLVMAAFGMP